MAKCRRCSVDIEAQLPREYSVCLMLNFGIGIAGLVGKTCGTDSISDGSKTVLKCQGKDIQSKFRVKPAPEQTSVPAKILIPE